MKQNEPLDAPLPYRGGCLDEHSMLNYLNETVTEYEHHEIENHLQKCKACFQMVEDYANSNNSA